ncbi:MAG: glycoside hydrolase family 25 protein, partial [Candidatus Nanopelagicales bacterium]
MSPTRARRLGATVGVLILLIAAAVWLVARDDRTRVLTGKDAAVPASARGQAADWDEQGVDGIYGVDLSLWDHGQDDEPIDFEALRAQGVRFAFIKTSDSHPRADAQAQDWSSEDVPAAKAAGIDVGYYQYAVPTANTDELTDQANELATVISERVGELEQGDLPVVLDLEEAPDTLTRAELTRFATTWLQRAEDLTGRAPLLYSNTDFLRTRLLPTGELTKYRLWQADYRKGSKPPTVPGWPADATAFWQFSSAGRLDGKPGTLTDLNLFLGTEAEYERLAGWR